MSSEGSCRVPREGAPDEPDGGPGPESPGQNLQGRAGPHPERHDTSLRALDVSVQPQPESAQVDGDEGQGSVKRVDLGHTECFCPVRLLDGSTETNSGPAGRRRAAETEPFSPSGMFSGLGCIEPDGSGLGSSDGLKRRSAGGADLFPEETPGSGGEGDRTRVKICLLVSEHSEPGGSDGSAVLLESVCL